MRKVLKVGDLVWYNVGGRGYETVGLVVEATDLWHPANSWEPKPQKYANCVRIQWMRVGKLQPRTINRPLYRAMYKYNYHEIEQAGFREWEREAVMPRLGKVEAGDWYEGRFFKVLARSSKAKP